MPSERRDAILYRRHQRWSLAINGHLSPFLKGTNENTIDQITESRRGVDVRYAACVGPKRAFQGGPNCHG